MLSSMGKVDHDTAINMLIDKRCPFHFCDMPYVTSLVVPPDYVRDKYRCPHCNCGVDYVGDEAKTDSIACSMFFLSRDGLISLTQAFPINDNID